MRFRPFESGRQISGAMLRFVNRSADRALSTGGEPGETGETVPRRIRFVMASEFRSAQKPRPSRSASFTGRSSSNLSDFLDEDSSDRDESTERAEPTERSPVESILSYRESDVGFDYFCKLRQRPYRGSRWIPEAEFRRYPGAAQTMKRYHNKYVFPPMEPFYDPAFDEVDRVIGQREGESGPEYLVKWMVLGYDECTWETDIDEEYIQAFERRSVPKDRRPVPKPDPTTYKKLEESPGYKNDMEVFKYQLEGLNWLTFCWQNDRNCILADEMGLGKTVQAVAFIEHIHKEFHVPGPFLVIAPLATLMHWSRVLTTWTDLNTIVYMGTKKARDVLYEYEFFYSGTDQPKFDVMVTSYEVMMKDVELFAPFEYSCLIVDEAHRLKNARSKLHDALRQISGSFRVLLTGTPLQNTMEELQSLLEFLHPGQFLDVTTASLSTAGIKDLGKRDRKSVV